MEATLNHPFPAQVLKQVLIVDMDRVRLRMVTSRVRSRFKVIMKTLEDVYPEVAWRTYVVNAPGYLRVIWTVVESRAGTARDVPNFKGSAVFHSFRLIFGRAIIPRSAEHPR